MGAGWLTLKADTRRAIPESFISSLKQTGIEPILQFQSSLTNPPVIEDMAQMLISYANWGVKYVQFFDRPNSTSAWSPAGWTQQNLVDRFVDRFLPLANLTLDSKMTPIFPPLEPGGGFWDTTFLQLALQAMKNRHQNDLLNKLVLSAYGWTDRRSLNWGAGGAERWVESRPYLTPAGCQDQRGFRIFDWYLEIASNFLAGEPEIFLFQAGQIGEPGKTLPLDIERTQNDQLCIAHLLCDETVQDPTAPHRLLEPIPDEVKCGCFWLLSAGEDTRESQMAWFSQDGVANKSAQMMKAWLQSGKVSITHLPASHSQDRSHPIARYVLLPVFEWGIADWHLEAIRPYVKKYQPTVGFDPVEAGLAKEVLAIGSDDEIPEEILYHLRLTGSKVDRICESGTSLASILAER